METSTLVVTLESRKLKKGCWYIFVFSKASESKGEDGFFMNNVEYKYTMLVLSVLNFCLLVLIVTMFIILWKWWKIGKACCFNKTLDILRSSRIKAK